MQHHEINQLRTYINEVQGSLERRLDGHRAFHEHLLQVNLRQDNLNESRFQCLKERSEMQRGISNNHGKFIETHGKMIKNHDKFLESHDKYIERQSRIIEVGDKLIDINGKIIEGQYIISSKFHDMMTEKHERIFARQNDITEAQSILCNNLSGMIDRLEARFDDLEAKDQGRRAKDEFTVASAEMFSHRIFGFFGLNELNSPAYQRWRHAIPRWSIILFEVLLVLAVVLYLQRVFYR